jgi:phosphoribosylglycinamide formyltransferase-1
MKSYKVAIFASGSGTNAENIIRYFQDYPNFSVPVVITNNSDAGVIERAKKLQIPCEILTVGDINTSTIILPLLQNKYEATHIVLAGYLKLIPEHIIDAYPKKILNIHPALLPKYGGKGMYGSAVHRSVKENGEIESGISIHIVSSHYDSG